MTLIAGVDTSTQSVKLVIRDLESGELIREGRASHPDGTECDPRKWEAAFTEAMKSAGGLDDVSAIGVGGQQHGAVVLDKSGNPIRPAMLWNDTKSASAADELNKEFGGDQKIAEAVGSKLVASFTITKLRWIANNEPEIADKIAAVCLPHDYLSWKLSGSNSIEDLFTDRSDASGTGYFDSNANKYRQDLLEIALKGRKNVLLPKMIEPAGIGGKAKFGAIISAGAGDNAGAALGANAGVPCPKI